MGCGVTPPTHSGTAWFSKVVSPALALDSTEADLSAPFIFSGPRIPRDLQSSGEGTGNCKHYRKASHSLTGDVFGREWEEEGEAGDGGVGLCSQKHKVVRCISLWRTLEAVRPRRSVLEELNSDSRTQYSFLEVIDMFSVWIIMMESGVCIKCIQLFVSQLKIK